MQNEAFDTFKKNLLGDFFAVQSAKLPVAYKATPTLIPSKNAVFRLSSFADIKTTPKKTVINPMTVNETESDFDSGYSDK